ncbi:MAG: AAA family ATPase, partial [Planctomycetota bacterium]
NGGYTALCPGHDDNRNSLSVGLGDDGRVLLHCHAGCSNEAVCKAVGLGLRDLFPTKTTASAGRTIAATYDYADEDGVLLYQKVRYEPKDFRCRVPDGAGGWHWKMNGTRRVLYRLAEVVKSGIVFVAEGEKDCDLLAGHGYAATCNYDGAGKWDANYNRYFKDKNVYILPDHDEAGRKHAALIYEQIKPVATDCRIVQLPGLGDRGDVSDFFANGGTIERFNEAAADAPEGLPESFETTEAETPPKRNTEPQREPVLVYRFALGKLSALGGDCDLGKSFIVLNMAALLSQGLPMPGEYGNYREAAGSIILTAEDGLDDTIKPRLDAMGADCTQIVALRGTKLEDREEEFDLMRDVEQLRTAISRVPNCKLIMIDPVSSYLGGVDTHRDAAVRSALRPLAEMADEMNVAVVCISHLNKNGGGNAKYRITGSVAFTAFGRSAWMVCEDQEDDTGQRRFMLPIKNNLTEAKKNGLAYRIIDNALQWESEPVELSAQDYISQHSPGPEPTERNEAEQFLLDVLADGSLGVKEIMSQARSNGISKATLRRAKSDLDIVTQKVGYGKDSVWRWSLSKEATQDDTG